MRTIAGESPGSRTKGTNQMSIRSILLAGTVAGLALSMTAPAFAGGASAQAQIDALRNQMQTEIDALKQEVATLKKSERNR